MPQFKRYFFDLSKVKNHTLLKLRYEAPCELSQRTNATVLGVIHSICGQPNKVKAGLKSLAEKSLRRLIF